MTDSDVFTLVPPVPTVPRKTRLKQKLALENAKSERKRLKHEEKQREYAKNCKSVTVQTVIHQPTYCCLSYRRIDGLKETRNPPAAFISKNEIQSIKSQTRLKNTINWLLLFADLKRVYAKNGRVDKKGNLILNRSGQIQHNFFFRLAFITLTLTAPQVHSDDFIKQHMLQPFLYWLTRYNNCLYVWKAESQLNGNIHFHITIDTFVHWKSIRSKWNKLLAKHQYCKVFQDGTNDRGDAATQIHSVINTKQLGKDIASYMQFKDRPKPKQLKLLVAMDPSVSNANVHCKFNPTLPPEQQDKHWYKRVIDGRLWGCSGVTYKKKDGKFIMHDGKKVIETYGLSNINVLLNEETHDFLKEETIFFHNPDVMNLGNIIIEKEKLKASKLTEPERQVRCITDDDIQRKYRFMKNVFIHKHLHDMKKGGTLQKLIHEEKLKRQKNFQTFFTEN
jgi:hypothetical protein